MSNNQENKKDENAEYNFLNNLFEQKEKDQSEQLYKNEFYILEEDIKSKKDQNSLQFMHDILLNKLMLEDYAPFPPKNDEPVIINNQKEEKKKEDDQDKLIEEENEFLRSLHKINYLTFSPFGLSFFDENEKEKNNMSEDLLKEREEKILQMIDFNYDNFEVTNDLLLNICQGFVDMNKLKEENLNKNKVKEPEKKIQPEKKLGLNNNNNNENNSNETEKDKSKETNKDKEKNNENVLDKSDLEFQEEIKEKKGIPFYKDILEICEKDIKSFNGNKKERKEAIRKWKSIVQKKDIEYQKYLIKKKEEEKKVMEENKKLQEIQKKKDKEKEEEEKNNDRLMKAFNDIIKRAQKNQKKSKSQNKVFKPRNPNKVIKARNKSTNLSPKKNNNSKITNKTLYNRSNNHGSAFNITKNYFNKNFSKSQTKIKTLSKNIFNK